MKWLKTRLFAVVIIVLLAMLLAAGCTSDAQPVMSDGKESVLIVYCFSAGDTVVADTLSLEDGWWYHEDGGIEYNGPGRTDDEIAYIGNCVAYEDRVQTSEW